MCTGNKNSIKWKGYMKTTRRLRNLKDFILKDETLKLLVATLHNNY